MSIKVCVLYGETTTEDQFKRLIDCLKKQTMEVEYHFYCHERVPFLEEIIKGTTWYIHYESGDPGMLRNEFLSEMVYKSELSKPTRYIAFLDGDDEIEPAYFEKLYSHGILVDADLVIGNPVLYYDENRIYPSKWFDGIQRGNEYIQVCAISDSIGGQAWGKLYSTSMFERYSEGYLSFGTGMFEDVPFWVKISIACGSVVFCDAKYIWHRDNPSAITRNLNSFESIKNGLENLRVAYSTVRNYFGNSYDVSFKKRYTWAIVTICRNIYKNITTESLTDVLISLEDFIDLKFVDFKLVDKTSQGWEALMSESKGNFKEDWLNFLGRDLA